MTAVEVVDGIDAGSIAHYGNPAVEGRALDDGTGVVDLSHRDVITVSGPDRLGWLHDLTTQHFTALAAPRALIVEPSAAVIATRPWCTDSTIP